MTRTQPFVSHRTKFGAIRILPEPGVDPCLGTGSRSNLAHMMVIEQAHVSDGQGRQLTTQDPFS